MKKNNIRSKDRNGVYSLISAMVQAGYSADKTFFQIKKNGMQFSAKELRYLISKIYRRMLLNRRAGI